jgi:hypothetical protein
MILKRCGAPQINDGMPHLENNFDSPVVAVV